MMRCYDEGFGKALLSQILGVQDGLSSERAYMFRALPLGVMRGLRDALKGDLTGLGRITAILAGLGVTATGYVVGVIHTRLTSQGGVDHQAKTVRQNIVR